MKSKKEYGFFSGSANVYRLTRGIYYETTKVE